MQYVSKRVLQAHTLSGGNTLRHTPVYGKSRPKHAVSEGFTTLAEDKGPEATLLIELSQNALQHHSCYKYGVDMLWSTLAEYPLVADSISDSMTNSQINGEVLNSEELQKHIAIKHWSDYVLSDVPTTEQNGSKMSKLKLLFN